MKHILTITDKEITGSDMLSSALPRIAVNAVLFDDDNNIALSYMGKYDLHTLPGRGVEPGEDFLAAVKREIWEEAGCECEITGELGQIYENRSEHDFTQERLYYIARVDGEKGSLHLTDEEIEAGTTVIWISLEQALKIISEKEHDNYQQKFIQKRDMAMLKEALIWKHTHNIPGYDAFVKTKPITKGWSGDKKYCVETKDGKRFYLRVSDIAGYDCKKAEYSMIERVHNIGIPTPKPVEFGFCDDGNGIYSLWEWIDGNDVDTVLPIMSETEQYVLGMKSGEILRKIHTLPASKNVEPWSERFRSKVQQWIDKYKSKPHIHSETGEMLISYLEKHRNSLDLRIQTFIHDDYNTENIMVMLNGDISIIDFSSFNSSYGDPWWDLDNMSWMPKLFPHFYTGQIKGYFDGEPSTEFWHVFTYYLAYDALAALTDPYGLNGIEDGTEIVNNILKWTGNFQNLVPTWYLKDFYIQWIDGLPYKLKTPFDFSFMMKYGNVFKVFDEQGSGNIAFGVQNGDKKYFIKFAGAPKPNYIANRDSGEVDILSAIALLKKAVPLYTELAHPTLIKFISAEEISDGYTVVFEWEDATSIEPKDSPDYMRFMQMPIEKKMRAFEDIVAFHVHVAAKGYVALDFYDGSILYDYEKEKVIICDIDLYQKSPFVNVDSLGIVGSARYVSPEECVKDAVMDEITNVYTMGATAFALFAYGNRSPEVWTLSSELYAVVKKAVSDDRNLRQQSIEQFIAEWRSAK